MCEYCNKKIELFYYEDKKDNADNNTVIGSFNSRGGQCI